MKANKGRSIRTLLKRHNRGKNRKGRCCWFVQKNSSIGILSEKINLYVCFQVKIEGIFEDDNTGNVEIRQSKDGNKANMQTEEGGEGENADTQNIEENICRKSDPQHLSEELHGGKSHLQALKTGHRVIMDYDL